ncbi:MAG: type II secretion system protein GspM [Thiotrichaceae bacterium]|uniref:Type II secretion system protein GspM n=1 Tax=Candidatus Thiocaldithrix dubininis TaxID=3080823 RepID=A0AA95H777_9GAMM|nr:MAG: type II secretion system protein GspM [Candidatus Thiocaldithrix dubininis]
MNAWWQNLNPSEKRLMLLGSIAIGLTLLWLFVLKPAYRYYSDLQWDVNAAKEVQSKLQQNRNKIQAFNQQANPQVPDDGQSLQSLVLNELRQFQLAGSDTATEDKDKNAVELKLSNKPFDSVIQLVGKLESQYQVHATSMTLTPAREAGRVDAQIALQR